MTIQRRSPNPIEHRKNEVRRYSRNAVVSVGGGLAGGFVVGFLFPHFWTWMALGMVIAVVGGVYNAWKVRQIVQHEDKY